MKFLENLPNNIFQLAGLLGALIIVYVFYQVVRGSFKNEEYQFRLSRIAMYLVTAMVLLIIYFLKPSENDNVSCGYDSRIYSYLVLRDKYKDCVDNNSSAYYRIGGTDSLDGIEKLSCDVLLTRLINAENSLTKIVQKYNLQQCD